jgi:7,8-dihydroneopterin aldolase/epimerase/oxygenase
MSDQIFVHGLLLHAYHGVAEHEARVGQSFTLDIVLELDLDEASRSDKLADTASYDDIVDLIREAFCGTRYRLVEAAAGAVADALLEAFRVESVRVTVHKPHAPLAAHFRAVGVTILRSRDA